MPTLAAAAPPAFTITLGSALLIVGAVLAVVDSAVRFRKPGGNALLAILALVAGLLLFVAAFGPVQQFVSTSIPTLWLAVATALLLIIQLLVKAARRSGLLPLTILAALVTAAAAVVTYFKVG
ncbi:hypothetical protein [uncultured Amnibacterium sp.]|uniref:hypothetical protein n=1 Tax=uncultured Amnibacterium sp. TaxID=1631851 RepID=UPI0035CC8186